MGGREDPTALKALVDWPPTTCAAVAIPENHPLPAVVTSSSLPPSILPLLVFLRRTLLPLRFVGHAWCFFYEVGSRLLHANKLLKQQQQQLLVLLSGPPHVHPCAGKLTPVLSDPYIQLPLNVKFPPFPHMLLMRSEAKQSTHKPPHERGLSFTRLPGNETSTMLQSHIFQPFLFFFVFFLPSFLQSLHEGTSDVREKKCWFRVLIMAGF